MSVDLASWTLEQFTLYALMLVRVAALFSVAPILGNASIPAQVKAAMAMVITLLLYLAFKAGHPGVYPVPGNIFALAGAVGGLVQALHDGGQFREGQAEKRLRAPF